MYKGITPTFTFTLPEDVNLSNASSVYVTFADYYGKELLTKTGNEIEVSGNVVNVYLTQDETLGFPTGTVNAQINWTYAEDGKTKRACSDIVRAFFAKNLQNKVLE